MTGNAVPADLLRSVVAYFKPRRVILFGSAAKGAAGADSGHDLLVVLDDDAPPEHPNWRASYEARRDWHRAVDIVQCRESALRARAEVVGSLAHTIAAEGVIVYERA
jgi:predicted nucleotidyltransferase